MIRYLPDVLRKGQVLMLNVTSLVHPLCTPGYVGGGFIGGDANAIDRWNISFYKTLQRAASHGYFIGKDQPWMMKTCLHSPDLCVLVQPQNCIGQDPWFFMKHVLHNPPGMACRQPPPPWQRKRKYGRR